MAKGMLLITKISIFKFRLINKTHANDTCIIIGLLPLFPKRMKTCGMHIISYRREIVCGARQYEKYKQNQQQAHHHQTECELY